MEHLRPKQNDPAVREKAIAKLAKACAEWANDAPGGWVPYLSRCNLHGNGYEIARDLERHAYVDPDLELVEILDMASSYFWEAHSNAVKAWVQANNIRPSLSAGTRIRCRYGEGAINDVREDEAIYLFVSDEDAASGEFANGGGTHVNYEDAEPIPVAA